MTKKERINIRVYDNGGQSFDRYTVVFDARRGGVVWGALGMSSNADAPNGFAQHTEAVCGPHLGRRIPFARLPKACQAIALDNLPEC